MYPYKNLIWLLLWRKKYSQTNFEECCGVDSPWPDITSGPFRLSRPDCYGYGYKNFCQAFISPFIYFYSLYFGIFPEFFIPVICFTYICETYSTLLISLMDLRHFSMNQTATNFIYCWGKYIIWLLQAILFRYLTGCESKYVAYIAWYFCKI